MLSPASISFDPVPSSDGESVSVVFISDPAFATGASFSGVTVKSIKPDSAYSAEPSVHRNFTCCVPLKSPSGVKETTLVLGLIVTVISAGSVGTVYVQSSPSTSLKYVSKSNASDLVVSSAQESTEIVPLYVGASFCATTFNVNIFVSTVSPLVSVARS